MSPFTDGVFKGFNLCYLYILYQTTPVRPHSIVDGNSYPSVSIALDFDFMFWIECSKSFDKAYHRCTENNSGTDMHFSHRPNVYFIEAIIGFK